MTGTSDLTAVVLAGGLGTRLRTITHDRYPKPMVPVTCGGRQYPFLEFVLARLKQQGITKFVLCLGHLGAAVQTHFRDGSQYEINILYDDAGEADTGARVYSALQRTDENEVLVTCGDVYHPIEIGPFMQRLQDRPDWQVALAATEEPEAGSPNMILAPDGEVLAHGDIEGSGGRAALEAGTLALRRSAYDGQDIGKGYSLTEDLFPALLQTRTLGAMIDVAPFFDIGTPATLARFASFAAAGGAQPFSRTTL